MYLILFSIVLHRTIVTVYTGNIFLYNYRRQLHQIIHHSLVGCFTPAWGKRVQKNREVSGVNDTQCSINAYVKINEGSQETLTVTIINLKTKVTAFIKDLNLWMKITVLQGYNKILMRFLVTVKLNIIWDINLLRLRDAPGPENGYMQAMQQQRNDPVSQCGASRISNGQQNS